MVTLRNRSLAVFVANLPHVAYCAGTPAGCACSTVTLRLGAEDPDGTRGIREVEKRIAASLRLLPGETRAGLPDSVLACPEVMAALDRRDLIKVQ
jgi:hypothetical protein